MQFFFSPHCGTSDFGVLSCIISALLLFACFCWCCDTFACCQGGCIPLSIMLVGKPGGGRDSHTLTYICGRSGFSNKIKGSSSLLLISHNNFVLFPFKALCGIIIPVLLLCYLLFFSSTLTLNVFHSSWGKVVKKKKQKPKNQKPAERSHSPFGLNCAPLLHQWLDSNATHLTYRTVCKSAIKISEPQKEPGVQASLARKHV